MKAVLFLCLLAFMACEKDIIDIGTCIYTAPKVQEIISEAMVAIITKDYTKIIDKIKESLPELIQIVIGCITEQPAVEDAPKAEGIFNPQCEYICRHGFVPLFGDELQKCLDRCRGRFY